jgi:hypothetical protein
MIYQDTKACCQSNPETQCACKSEENEAQGKQGCGCRTEKEAEHVCGCRH